MKTEAQDRGASVWLARLDRGDATADDRAAFEAWRTEDPRHAAAYDRLQALWQRLDRLQTFRTDLNEPIDPDALDSLLFVPSTRASSAPPHFTAAAPWLAAAGVAAIAAVAALVFAFLSWRTPLDVADIQHYVTEIGGHQRALLNDGSIAELNTDTELQVTLNDTERRVELVRGEASFEVARDPRPFSVTAGDVTIRAVGTLFNVRRREDLVEILVVEGIVAVGSSIIQAGETAVAAPAGLEIRAIESKQLERALAWKKGMLALDSVTLIEAAREFNRYNARRLVVTDPAIANLRIVGYFRATNVDGFVRVLEGHFAIVATRQPTQILLSRAASPPKQ